MTPSRPGMIRLMLVMSGLLAGVCAVGGASHGMSIESRSILLWGAVAAAGLGSIASLICAIAVTDVRLLFALEHLQLLTLRLRSVHNTDQHTEQVRRYGYVLLGLGCLLFALNVTWVWNHQDPPDDDDQMAYLMTAQEIHDSGGLRGLWTGLWSGQFPESNRHPLPLALQAIHPSVTFARIVSCVSASVLMITTLIVVWRRFGPLTAGILAVLLGSNGAWIFHTPRFVCECQLTGICALAWLCYDRIQGQATLSTWRSLLTGSMVGLAWLTKGTGLLLLGAVLICQFLEAILDRSRRAAHIRSACLVALAFVVTASPLLTRNVIRFGSPTYNVNSYLLWVDAYESPHDLAERMTLREARDRYLASHPWPVRIRREVSGLVWEAFIGLRTMGLAPWEDGRILTGLPLLAFALLGAMAASRSTFLLLLVWTGITWIVMAWYIPIAAGDRFMMPLLIPWLILSADGLARWSATRPHPDKILPRLMLGVAAAGVVTTITIWKSSQIWAG